MKIRLLNFSFRFAEQVLNRDSRLLIKQEIEEILNNPNIDLPS